jgi:radical SAM superfamily enzyme YgiQ (UPF0313 family)
MKKKIYLIHPSYRDQNGVLLKGRKLYVVSLALPALSAAIPSDWEKECCLEYFEHVNLDTDASVVGISSMGYEIFRGIELAAEFRKRGKVVIFGGFQPHISREFVGSYADTVIHGYPGPADMAQILADAVSGSLQSDFQCRTDLNYRFDYSIVDMRRSVFAPVLTGVGCRNACDYCCIGSFFHGMYTLRKIEYVLEELDVLSRTTRRIAFVDTNLYNNARYVERLCTAMIDRGYGFIWGAQCTIDIGDDPETLTLMKKAGCRVLFIGLETIEQENLDAVRKHYRVDSYRQKIEAIHRAGIRIAAFFMYGLDGDTLATSDRMSEFIIEHKIALPMLNILVPTPGTPMYAQLKREGRILMSDEQEFLKNNIAYNSSFNLCFYTPKNMTPAQVEEGFLDLLRRLSGIPQIIRRSLSTDIPFSLFLLYMNWLFRREYVRLRKQRSNGANVMPASSIIGSRQKEVLV